MLYEISFLYVWDIKLKTIISVLDNGNFFCAIQTIRLCLFNPTKLKLSCVFDLSIALICHGCMELLSTSLLK